jgi:hypothetical protein
MRLRLNAEKRFTIERNVPHTFMVFRCRLEKRKRLIVL